MTRRQILALIASITLSFPVFVTTAATPPKPGSVCKKANLTQVYFGKKYTCVKNGKKLIWNKGVDVAKKQLTPTPSASPTPSSIATPTPSPTATPTPSPTPTPTPTNSSATSPTATPTPIQAKAPLVLSWEYRSTVPIVPGTLVDGDPMLVQDNNLNSSFVVLATRDGLPAVGETIVWKSDDPTANIKPYATRTDKHGLARAWYFAGLADKQKVTAFSPEDSLMKIESELLRAANTSKTVGRYVATYLSAAGHPKPSEPYDGFSIQITPLASPLNTYYQMITSWQTRNPGDTSFYGGIQQANCTVGSGWYPKAVCEPSRGNLQGRLALFSAWNANTPSGVISPKVASLGPDARCVGFSHEGSGLSCSQPLDWEIGVSVTWKVEILGELVSGFTRVKSSVKIGQRGSFLEVATLDLPDQPNLSTVSQFVEEWGGNESPNCLDVAVREMEINSLVFTRKGESFRPIYGQAIGGLYSDSSTRCLNYTITTTQSGIRIKSGGLNNWVDFSPIIKRNSSRLPFGEGFVDLYQSLWLWQDVDVSSLR